MHLSLRHAFYSAILSTEATATFMFLPSWKGSMITNPYSHRLTAFPHLCYNLGTIPADEVMANIPIPNARHAETASGLKQFKNST